MILPIDWIKLAGSGLRQGTVDAIYRGVLPMNRGCHAASYRYVVQILGEMDWRPFGCNLSETERAEALARSRTASAR